LIGDYLNTLFSSLATGTPSAGKKIAGVSIKTIELRQFCATFSKFVLPPSFNFIEIADVLPPAAAHVNGHSHLPDLSQGSSRSEAQPPASHAQTSLIEKRPFPAADPEALGSLAAGQQDIRREITRLHREIAVLRAEMAQPGLTEILGGIGYIIGFFGLYAWFRVRRGTPV